ncbi:MAG: hypothetical protein FWG52_01190 [Proteobacteria bacterium]|nr:hypothetical protein [Pseudomonadota bacterium]
MTRRYTKRTDPRIPESVDGLQLNVCRNPLCANFGIPPKQEIKRGRQPKGFRDNYSLKGLKGGNSSREVCSMMCLVCGGEFRLISNQGVREERDRFLMRVQQNESPSCPNEACENHFHSVAADPGCYMRYGTTPVGAQRYRCLGCNKTFSASPHLGRKLRQPEKTELVFSLLINKSPMRRICEVAGVNAVTLYQRIDLIYKKCLRIAQRFERPLLEEKAMLRMHVAVDRQDHAFNWGTQLDRRVVTLRAIASSDANSGYVLAQHLNFEPGLDPREIELAARESGDDLRSPPFRHAPRFWLKADHHLIGPENEANDECLDAGTKLPAKGMQIFENYTLFGHFFYLARLLGGVKQLQFSLDGEPNIYSACLLAFQQWFSTGSLFVFLVRIDKKMSNDRKGMALAAAERIIQQQRALHPDLSDIEVALELIKVRHREISLNSWAITERWVSHPLPKMNEPYKAVRCMAAPPDADPVDLAWGYLRTSLNAIDRYFMQLRRRISVLERPISTASSTYRRWHGYQAYNPEVGMKLLEIFRVAYNYHLAGKDNQTPAQRLGLAPHAINLSEILEA